MKGSFIDLKSKQILVPYLRLEGKPHDYTASESPMETLHTMESIEKLLHVECLCSKRVHSERLALVSDLKV